MSIKRVIVIVLDGVGIGEAPDADLYGDEGSNSIVNTAQVIGGLNVPNMGELGLGNITPIAGVPPTVAKGAFGKLQPMSAGKDSVTGHWELMGIHLAKPFPTYPDGFPSDVIDEFVKRTGKSGVLGNKAASGTEIIDEYGAEHMQTGNPIVYTSADSVFQIAAHEEIIPIPELYKICEIARELLVGDHGVGRVIARPFVGTPGNFKRTERRHDYPLMPTQQTMLDKLVAAKKDVYAVGKIDDLFGGRGITQTAHSANNEQALKDFTEKFLPATFEGLLFVNLVEFDMIYGHRNDPQGYAGALSAFDQRLPQIQALMRDDDIAIIAADHGVDPTTPSTDHSREYVPLLVFGKQVQANVNLGTRKTFSDVGATIAEIFALEKPTLGQSFLAEIVG